MIQLIKTLTWLASPIGFLAVSCLVAGTLLALHKAPKARLLLVTLGISQLLFFSWPPVATTLSQALEAEARMLQNQNQGGPYQAIVLLGGGITAKIDDEHPANAGEAFDRIIYAAQLYRRGLAPLVIVSGGVTLPNAESEAQAMKDSLLLLGVTEQAILLENQSLNTRQNITNTMTLLKNNGIEGKSALVTSAAHMPRAAANAKKAGLDVDFYPTDWGTPLSKQSFTQTWLPNAQGLEESERSIKEWIALLVAY